jgi:hypothetical protein
MCKTQTESVLAHLEKYGSITSMDAIQLYGATRLSAIIYDLRHKEGYTIETEIETVPTRHGTHSNIARYRLRKDENEIETRHRRIYKWR